MKTVKNWQLMIMTFSISILAIGGLTDAYAMPMIKLTEGTGASALITDEVIVGDADESPGIPGLVSYTQFIGNFDLINAEVGVTKPLSGTPFMPELDMDLITISSAAGTLRYEFTDVDFQGEDIKCLSIGGGSTEGTVTYSVYMDPGNVPFAMTELLFTTTSDGIGDIDANGMFNAAPGAGPYSLTLVADITHAEIADTSSYDIRLECGVVVGGEIVPINSSALLVGGILTNGMFLLPIIGIAATAGTAFTVFRHFRKED